MYTFLGLFKRFAGNGRAWKLKDLFTLNSVKAFLSVAKTARTMFNTLPAQAYPWSCDDTVIPYWERQFNINPPAGVSLPDRRRTVIAEYTAIGSNAAEYLEFILSSNDHDAQVVENLSGVEMGGTWDVLPFKIANGLVATYPNPAQPPVYTDPVAKPVNTKQWKKVYILLDKYDNSSVELLRTLVLKYSSSHTVAMLVNNDPDSLYFDAEIVNALIVPLSVFDAELVVSTTPPNTQVINGLVYDGDTWITVGDDVVGSISFNPDMSKMYKTGSASDPYIYEFDLITPGEVSTAVYNGASLALTPVSPGLYVFCMCFNGDGTRLYIGVTATLNRLVQFNLSTPWDITTATNSGDFIEFSTIGTAGIPTGVDISQDGGRIYLATLAEDIHQIDLTTPYELSSGGPSITTLDINTLVAGELRGDIAFNRDGDKLIVGFIKTVAFKGVYIELDLLTPWDVTTSTYNGGQFQNPGFLLRPDAPRGVWVPDDGLTIYLNDYEATVGESRIFRFSTSTGFNNPVTQTNAESVLDAELVV
jgi:hypothetical protein